ncbi:cellulase family glycosylhydrolase [Actinospica sp. MGRD01-02]|uniref:Cellulase family glycosylhydrolase n=1 Tax=Actinospica acidithermotolerans TaxID=2828514 RepID=A0A941EKA1_9ACTN|nr:cellulase family glycosylhydrolase [Actinospica acidithermotolerans]MBR7829159.1 cellulase family glycosylhydrolase [Actinospica acidithermotolerans]
MVDRRTRRPLRALSALLLAGATGLLFGASLADPAPARAAAIGTQWFDDAADSVLTVQNGEYVDGYGREVVLRGFNVSGESKLAENEGLPFASVADAEKSAAAMRQLTGADAVRFLVTWAYVEPEPGQIDYTYLADVVAQMKAFLDEGIYVFVDFHQDLYSRYIFNSGSWYTGDGAPDWVIADGGYPTENCGICVTWGQNLTSNAAVEDAMYDFWHNRTLTTTAGQISVQSEYLSTAETSLAYIKSALSTAEFDHILGVDPYNEPYAGKYDSGQTSSSWESGVLWPFYEKFRAEMDDAGWQAKEAYIEPNVFWNTDISAYQQAGGLTNIGSIGTHYVFNAHFYDAAALSGILLLGDASDGQYISEFNTIRGNASALGTAAMVSEFGSPVTGYTSDKSPSVLKAMYQALDSGVDGANWWTDAAASSGSVLSGTEWQWDIYNGRHDELMNGNSSKVETSGDAWNGEDYSVVDMDSSGTVDLRYSSKLLDRVYPEAVAGTTLAFTYEDRSPNGSTTMTWNPVPSSMTAVSALVGSGQYSVLVWKSNGGSAPTQINLPLSFTASNTTVVSDLGSVLDPPTYSASNDVAGHAVAVAALPGGGGAERLLLSDPGASGTVHFALVTNGSTTATATQLATAQSELASWVASQKF